MTLSVISKILIFVLLFLILHLYFFPEVVSFFSQDDFFHLSTVMSKGIFDIPSFFYKLNDEYAFYRPVSREVYNLIALNTFGLNPLPYHFVNLGLILANGLLGIRFFSLLEKKLNNILFKIIFLLIFLSSAIHSVELYYLSSVQTLLAAFFILISLNYYLRNRLYSLVFFILGVMSHESSFVFIPIILVLYLVYSEKSFITRFGIAFKSLTPFLLIFLARALIHFLGFGLDGSSTYQPSFSLQNMLNTLLWYVLWSFGLPEMLVDFATLRLQFNPNLFKFYGHFTGIVFPAFLLALIILGTIFFRIKKIFFQKTFIFLCLAFLSSLLPLIFFPTHKFIYYLSFPSILFSGVLSYACFEFLLLKKKSGILVLVFLGLYLLISYQTLQVNKVTYWAAKRAKSAEFILKDFKNKHPVLNKGIVIYVKDDPKYPFISKEWGTSSKQASYILSGADAFSLLFKDPTLKTYYQAVTGPPKEKYLLENLVVYEARFPY